MSNINTCDFCNKNCLIKFTCKCENGFCVKHRLPEYHNCKFDFQTYYKKLIEEMNPHVESPKVQYI